jgi:phospholipid/cholesterol/gamma-HCH transport system substrate-binding protein
MEAYKNKVKLGIFVIGGIVLFLASLFYLGRENNFFSKTFTVMAVFKNVEGLNAGDNVWLSGVKIGTVKDVKIVTEGQVVVTMALKEKQNQFIKKDATATVGSDGLVGNKIVVIRPGMANATIVDQDTIKSLSPTDTQELFNVAKDVGTNTEQITRDLKLITQKIVKGEGILGDIVNDGEISQDIRATVSLLKASASNTQNVSRQAADLLSEVRNGDGLVPHLLTDSSYTGTFEKMLSDLAEAGASARVMSDDLRRVTAQLDDEDNMLHLLLSDSAAAEDLRKTLGAATSAAEKLDENMTALQSNFLFRRYFRKKEKEAQE